LTKEKTMTRNIIRSRARTRTSAKVAAIHIPHSSWNRTEPQSGRKALIAPDDFWARLGL
jgi:hypothetical protein